MYIEGLTDGGRYYLRELENPGYVPDTQMKTVYVKAGEVTLVEWQNTPITGQIQVTKTSADYNSMNGWPAGTPIPGTEFEIYHYRTGNLVDTVRTDKNGVAVSKPLPLGRYKIVESKAAAFFGLDKTPHRGGDRARRADREGGHDQQGAVHQRVHQKDGLRRGDARPGHPLYLR